MCENGGMRKERKGNERMCVFYRVNFHNRTVVSVEGNAMRCKGGQALSRSNKVCHSPVIQTVHQKRSRNRAQRNNKIASSS